MLSVPGDGDIVEEALAKCRAGSSMADAKQIAEFIAGHYTQWITHGVDTLQVFPETEWLTRRAQAEKAAAVLHQVVKKC